MACGSAPLSKGATVTIDGNERKRSGSTLRRCATVEGFEAIPCSCHVVTEFPPQKRGPDKQTCRTIWKVSGVKSVDVLLKSVHVGACARCILIRCVALVALGCCFSKRGSMGFWS